MITHPAAINRRLSIGGPEPVSWRDIVAVFERLLGRTIPVRTVSRPDEVPEMPEIVFQALAALETYDAPQDMTELVRTYGVKLTSVEEYVREYVRMNGVATAA